MFQTRCSKELMEYIEKTPPDKDGFYCAMDFVNNSPFSVREAEDAVRHLVREELLEQPFHGRPDILRPTIYGAHYTEFRRYRRRHFFAYSVLCPIVVTILTELAIHGLGLLLQLL
ncbi:MAG TPA: hypothetical protein DDX51_03985 [Clostridiales bacterium]|nr:hypothetical protein [Clostridiales bacterium]